MICILKLVTGEDVLAEITDHGDRVSVRNPVRIIYTQNGVGMSPLSPLARAGQILELSLSRQHIVFQMEADQEVCNAYNAQFGNNIVIAQTIPDRKAGPRLIRPEED